MEVQPALMNDLIFMFLKANHRHFSKNTKIFSCYLQLLDESCFLLLMRIKWLSFILTFTPVKKFKKSKKNI